MSDPSQVTPVEVTPEQNEAFQAVTPATASPANAASTPKDEFSSAALSAKFDSLMKEDPATASAKMSEHIEEAAKAGKISAEYKKIMDGVLDDVECARPDLQAQVFKDGVEENKDELAKALLLRDAAQEQTALLTAAGPLGILFAMLSMLGGGFDFMDALTNVMDELGVDTKEMKAKLENNSPPANTASTNTTDPVKGQETPREQPANTAPAEQVTHVDISQFTQFDFSGADSEFQGDNSIRADAIVALSQIDIPTSGIDIPGQQSIPEQPNVSASYNPLALS